MKRYRVKAPLRLGRQLRNPGDIVRGDYDLWVVRGYLEPMAGASMLAPKADVAVRVSTPSAPEPVPDPFEFEDDEEDWSDD